MLVAKYKFDKSIYENLIPVFNDGYEGYTITDEIDENDSNVTIRTIECDSLPTKMKFGDDVAATDRELSLLEILDMNINEVTSLRQMFMYCENLTSITCDWNINNEVTSLRQMFYNCKSLTLVDVSRWDTSNVNNMRQIFYNCENLTQIDVSNWNTSLVDDMNNMFYDCKSLTSIDMSNWNTNLVDDMSYMFYSCDNLIQLDLSNFDTSKVTNIENMFYSTSSLQYIRCNNVSTINTLASLLPSKTSSTQGKIITTSSTDVDTTTLSSLNWSVDISSGTKIAEYVYDKSMYNYLIPEFNEGYGGYFVNDKIEDESKPNIVTRELVGYGGLPTLMRFGTRLSDSAYVVGSEIALLKVLNMNTSGLTDMTNMFKRCVNVIDIYCDWNTTGVTSMYATFKDCENLVSLDVSNFDTSNVESMWAMFSYCINLTTLDVSNWDTSNVINMYSIFHYCNKLTTLDVSNWNTSKVTGMGKMFFNCTNLTSLDLSNWDTSKVIDMSYMFHGCSKLTELDLSNFDTNNVTTMYGMFYNCNSLTTLDLSNFDTSKVTSMYAMFSYCSNLTSLDLSNWDTSKVIDINSMFQNTPKLLDIGMLYCSQDTINKIIPLITNGSKTIWVKDTKASDYTATDYVTIKDYKEDNRTLYLNSPLLEGDEIINKDGKLYHYHKMGKKVFDGSEDEGWDRFDNNINDNGIAYVYNSSLNVGISKRHIICDIFKVMPNTKYNDQHNLTDYNQILTHHAAQYSNHIYVSTELTVDKFKTMLSSNPMTLIYELAEPYYELISDDPLIVQSYAEGKLDTSSIITPTSIQSIPYEEELTYLYTSTQYCVQFNSTANCTVDITLGGTKVENKSVSVGLNKIYITTPSTLVDNKLIINAKGNATISKVVVVNSNAEFDYFDGLKSSFEDCLVTDVDNENYGKYEVGVKIVGKNLFNVYGNINEYYNSLTDTDYGKRYNHQLLDGGIIKVIARTYNHYTRGQIIKVKRNTNYAVKFGKVESVNHRQGLRVLIATLKNEIIHRVHDIKTNHEEIVFNSLDNDYIYFSFAMDGAQDDTMYSLVSNIQLEEGDTTTSYEPYKETNATIYLNSPLLQGDRIEMYNGKLCHYHKMRSVVLDGSEDEKWHEFVIEPGGLGRMMLELNNMYSLKFCNNLSIINWTNSWNTTSNAITLTPLNNNKSFIVPYINVKSIDAFKQWLSENPTTVVYRLTEPYYEDITPIQSSFVISTVSEGDMEILTDLPIKSNITYLTNITSAVLMEQQLDELDNSTESLTNIVEDEINE